MQLFVLGLVFFVFGLSAMVHVPVVECLCSSAAQHTEAAAGVGTHKQSAEPPRCLQRPETRRLCFLGQRLPPHR